MQLEIITPERKIFEGEADAVQFPGLDGSFQVLNGHAPVISSLAQGEVKVNLTEVLGEEVSTDGIVVDSSDNKIIRVPIKGGVVEMLNNKVIILAE